MADQSIACPSCGKKIPLTRALRADIETSVKADFDRRLETEVERARKDAAAAAEKRTSQELSSLKEELRAQSKALDNAHQQELDLRRRERELERRAHDVQLSVARQLDAERTRIAAETQERFAEQHRLKDVEKERQLADMRRQIEDLKRRAEQGSQQTQGEAGETELEAALRLTFPTDDVLPVAQGVRGRRHPPGSDGRPRRALRRDPLGVQERESTGATAGWRSWRRTSARCARISACS
jgi:hypothetical protein